MFFSLLSFLNESHFFYITSVINFAFTTEISTSPCIVWIISLTKIYQFTMSIRMFTVKTSRKFIIPTHIAICSIWLKNVTIVSMLISVQVSVPWKIERASYARFYAVLRCVEQYDLLENSDGIIWGSRDIQT